MEGWFRAHTHDFQSALSQGNANRAARNRSTAGDGTMKGVVFDRDRADGTLNEWDGQFTIAALESPGVEVFYQNEFLADGDGKSVWTPFSKDGSLANSDTSWVSASEKIGGAIAVRFTLNPAKRKSSPWPSRGTFPSSNSASAASGIAATPISTAPTATIPGRSRATACYMPAEWSDAIDAWQKPYINEDSKPDWYRAMLFNELYTLTDGGTFWGRPQGPTKAPRDVRAARMLRLRLLRHARRSLLCLDATAEILARHR